MIANVFFLQLFAFRVFPIGIVVRAMLVLTDLFSAFDVFFLIVAFSGIDLALLSQASCFDLILFMNFVALAVVLLAFASNFETAAIIITLILIGRLLESRTKEKASHAVRKLLDLQPRMAKVLRQGKEGKQQGEEEVEIPVEQVQEGEIMIVRPSASVSPKTSAKYNIQLLRSGEEKRQFLHLHYSIYGD